MILTVKYEMPVLDMHKSTYNSSEVYFLTVTV